ncbi:hypothetical protein Btru_029538 [Bulinus truncatus]|nr:hypothetical protein Btru_029538 [Bulinus truncatus]
MGTRKHGQGPGKEDEVKSKPTNERTSLRSKKEREDKAGKVIPDHYILTLTRLVNDTRPLHPYIDQAGK